MNNKKEKWIADVFQSMKGSQRAKPQADLLGKIERQLFATEAKIIPLTQLRIAVVAAVLLLIVNVSALVKTTQNDNPTVHQMTETESTNPPLISNYNIYE